jgi:hypothetical protein
MLELAVLPHFQAFAIVFQYVTLFANLKDGVEVAVGSNPAAPTYFFFRVKEKVSKKKAYGAFGANQIFFAYFLFSKRK